MIKQSEASPSTGEVFIDQTITELQLISQSELNDIVSNLILIK